MIGGPLVDAMNKRGIRFKLSNTQNLTRKNVTRNGEPRTRRESERLIHTDRSQIVCRSQHLHVCGSAALLDTGLLGLRVHVEAGGSRSDSKAGRGTSLAKSCGVTPSGRTSQPGKYTSGMTDYLAR